jgi:hypothetical protein
MCAKIKSEQNQSDLFIIASIVITPNVVITMALLFEIIS